MIRRGNAGLRACLGLGDERRLQAMQPHLWPLSPCGIARPFRRFRNRLVPLLLAFAFALFAAAADSPQVVHQIRVQPDQAPDCTSLKTIAESITRGCRNNDEKAVAIYNFMQLAHYHRQYPSEPGGLPVLKELHCYGWSLCGGLHAEQSALWRQLGWDWRFVGWDGHTTVEANYDGRWHYPDAFLKFYAWMPDGRGGWTIAGEDELNQNAQGLIRDAFVLDEGRRCVYRKTNPFAPNGTPPGWRTPSFLACGDTIDDVIAGLKTHRGRDHSAGWGGIEHADGDYSADVNLAPGCCLENRWDPIPGAWYWAGEQTAPAHTCAGHKDTRNDPGIGLVLEPYVNRQPARSYANGVLTFAPDFAGPGLLASFASADNAKAEGRTLVPAQPGKRASVVVSLASPYPLTRVRGEAPGAEVVEVSVDGGKTFQTVALADFSAAVQGRLAVLVRVTFSGALQALRIEALVQNNPGVLPYLSPGRNRVTVSVADPRALGDHQLVVTYAYQLGSRSKSLADLHAEGKEVANQRNAEWSDTVTCAQRVFRAGDLPATFEIDCPTPLGRQPVYPRMLFLRREVIAPGATPLPLPAGAMPARVGPGEELKALPNPFLVGTGE